VDDDAIVRLGPTARKQFIAHVAQPGVRIAFKRIAPAAAARKHVAEHVALADRHRELRWKEAVIGFWIEIIFGWLTGAAAIEPERPVVTPVGADLEQPLVLEESIVAPKWNAATKLSGPGLVRHEFVRNDRQRLFALRHLDRLGGNIRHLMRFPRGAVSPGAPPPSPAGKTHVDKGLGVRFIAADGNAGVAAAPRRH